MNQNFVYLFLLCFITVTAYADNPVCNNTDEIQIYNEKCYSFGDEFVFISNDWPKYGDGGDMPEKDVTCFEKFSYAGKVKSFTQYGVSYDIYSLNQYCCKHQVFQTRETRWGNENDGYVDFSVYGNYGVFYSECEYQESKRMDTSFAVTKLQKSFDEVDLLNLAADAEKIFGSRENAAMKYALFVALVEKGEIPFKFYRPNGTVKYIGGKHLGFCMSKNGKKHWILQKDRMPVNKSVII